MSKPTPQSKRRQSALLMAFYTFLLALGAALPLAASYSPGLQSRHTDAHLRVGGYQQRPAVAVEDTAEQAQAPTAGRVAPSAAVCTEALTACDDLAAPDAEAEATHTDFTRGS